MMQAETLYLTRAQFMLSYSSCMLALNHFPRCLSFANFKGGKRSVYEISSPLETNESRLPSSVAEQNYIHCRATVRRSLVTVTTEIHFSEGGHIILNCLFQPLCIVNIFWLPMLNDGKWPIMAVTFAVSTVLKKNSSSKKRVLSTCAKHHCLVLLRASCQLYLALQLAPAVSGQRVT